MINRIPLAAAAIWLSAVMPLHAAPEDVVARVNGVAITEADFTLAESEVGGELANVPQGDRRRLLLDYLVSTQLMAEAAEKDKLGTAPGFEDRLKYYKRRALRDAFYDTQIKSGASETVARAIYDDQIKTIKPEEEVRARHILVESEDEAKKVIERLKNGEDFAAVAKEVSKDPSAEGGDLGYFGRGQMVKTFEDAVFQLDKGQLSEPVKSQFGWHVIKVEDKREKPLPAFDQVKDQIMASLTQQKSREAVTAMRKSANVEILDAAIKKANEDAQRRTPGMPGMPGMEETDGQGQPGQGQ